MNNTYRFIFTMVLVAIIGYMINDIKSRIEADEMEIAALKAELAAHREDAKTAVTKIYEDIGKVRFTQAALANSIRFATGK